MARLSSPLQLEHLQRAFTDLNPGYATDLIDWKATLDDELTMAENVQAFEEFYPQFEWVRPETVGPRAYEEMVIAGLAKEAEPYGFDLVRINKLEGFRKLPGRLEKVKIALEKCRGIRPKRAPRPRVTCPDKDKIEVCFLRCPRPG